MKTIKIRNKNHPVNMMQDHGQCAKAAARKLSNVELDDLLSTNIPNADDLAEILAWTRGRKIKFIRRCSMNNFADAYKKHQEEVEKSNDLQPTKGVE